MFATQFDQCLKDRSDTILLLSTDRNRWKGCVLTDKVLEAILSSSSFFRASKPNTSHVAYWLPETSLTSKETETAILIFNGTGNSKSCTQISSSMKWMNCLGPF